MRVFDHKIDELLALKDFLGFFMTFTWNHNQLRVTAKLSISPNQFRGVPLNRDRTVAISVDMQNRDLLFGKWGETFEWVVLVEVLAELLLGGPVGCTCFCEARPTAQVTHGVDPSNGSDMLRILRSPVVQHQSTAALRHQNCLFGKPVIFDKMFVELAVGFSSCWVSH